MAKLKILFSIGNYGLGGKERQMTELIKALPHEKYQIHLFAKKIDGYFFDEIKSFLTSFYSLDKENFNGFKSFIPFFKYFKQVQPDIIHSWATNTTTYSSVIKILHSKSFQLIDGSIRDAMFNYIFFSKPFFERKFNNIFPDIIIGNSKAGLNAYSIPNHKNLCIYNGFDFKRIENIPAPKKIKSKYQIDTKYIVCMVGRFHHHKDWETYLKAAVIVTEKRNDTTFLCIGGGAELNSYKRLYAKYKNIIFTGKQSRVEDFINLCDICVLTTNPVLHAEGISNVIMEYMAMAKPVIATEGGGTPEIIKNKESGLIIPQRSPEILAEKIEWLFNHPECLQRLGQNAKKRIINCFSINKMVKNYMNIYKST